MNSCRAETINIGEGDGQLSIRVADQSESGLFCLEINTGRHMNMTAQFYTHCTGMIAYGVFFNLKAQELKDMGNVLVRLASKALEWADEQELNAEQAEHPGEDLNDGMEDALRHLDALIDLGYVYLSAAGTYQRPDRLGPSGTMIGRTRLEAAKFLRKEMGLVKGMGLAKGREK